MTKPFTYSPKLIAFLLRHWNIDVPGPRLAELVGVPYTNLKAQIERLRKRGYDFKRKELPIGTQILRKNGKQGYTLKEKGADGQWKYVASIANPKQVKAKQQKDMYATFLSKRHSKHNGLIGMKQVGPRSHPWKTSTRTFSFRSQA